MLCLEIYEEKFLAYPDGLYNLSILLYSSFYPIFVRRVAVRFLPTFSFGQTPSACHCLVLFTSIFIPLAFGRPTDIFCCPSHSFPARIPVRLSHAQLFFPGFSSYHKRRTGDFPFIHFITYLLSHSHNIFIPPLRHDWILFYLVILFRPFWTFHFFHFIVFTPQTTYILRVRIRRYLSCTNHAMRHNIYVSTDIMYFSASYRILVTLLFTVS